MVHVSVASLPMGCAILHSSSLQDFLKKKRPSISLPKVDKQDTTSYFYLFWYACRPSNYVVITVLSRAPLIIFAVGHLHLRSIWDQHYSFFMKSTCRGCCCHCFLSVTSLSKSQQSRPGANPSSITILTVRFSILLWALQIHHHNIRLTFCLQKKKKQRRK